MAWKPEPVSEPGSPAPPCPRASLAPSSDATADAVSAAVPNAVADEEKPVPWAGVMEICSAANGAAAAAVGPAVGAGEDAAAFAACKADAADPVASEPSMSARSTSALLAAGVCAAGVCAVVAASSAGAADVADRELLGAAGRPPAAEPAAPLLDASAGRLDADTGAGRVPADAAVVVADAADDFAARATAAAEAALDGGVAEAADVPAADVAAAASVAVLVSPTVESEAAVAASTAVSCALAAPCWESVVGAGSPVEVTVPAALAVATPATPGAAGSEASSPPSSRREAAAGAPFAPRICSGIAGAATGAVEAGGVTLPDGGNGSPLRLPAPALPESSFRVCLAEARSSAPAKSRAPEPLAAGSADAAAFGEFWGGAC